MLAVCSGVSLQTTRDLARHNSSSDARLIHLQQANRTATDTRFPYILGHNVDLTNPPAALLERQHNKKRFAHVTTGSRQNIFFGSQALRRVNAVYLPLCTRILVLLGQLLGV